MKTKIRVLALFAVSIAFCLSAAAGDRDLLAALLIEDIEAAHIILNPSGADLGFESVIDGDDPRLAPLIAVIKNADPGGGHKCPNRGAIRFRMAGGGVIAVGLLPSHSEGLYEFRLYDGDRLEKVYRVEREPLLTALAALGVPVDDPAFND